MFFEDIFNLKVCKIVMKGKLCVKCKDGKNRITPVGSVKCFMI